MARTHKTYRLDDSTIDLITELKINLKLPTATATIVQALKLLEAVHLTQAAGGSVVLLRPNAKPQELFFLS